jgi:L-fuculose-phosphate aldolase
MRSEMELRQEICEIGYKLYTRNYIVGMDGNLSVRLPGNVLLCTASGDCKGELHPEQILKTDMEGHKISGEGVPSSELAVHLAVYQERPDVRAVVHAHPLTAVALTLAGKALDQIVLPEVAFYLGKIAVAPYLTPGSEALASSMRPFLKESDAIVLSRHGTITVGKTLTEAYYKVEYVEYAAQVVWLATQLGPLVPLDLQEIQKLQGMRQKQLAILQGIKAARGG